MFQQNLQLCTISGTTIMTHNMHLYVNKKKTFFGFWWVFGKFPFLYLDNKIKGSQRFWLILISGITSNTFLLLCFAFLDILADPVKHYWSFILLKPLLRDSWRPCKEQYLRCNGRGVGEKEVMEGYFSTGGKNTFDQTKMGLNAFGIKENYHKWKQKSKITSQQPKKDCIHDQLWLKINFKMPMSSNRTVVRGQR